MVVSPLQVIQGIDLTPPPWVTALLPAANSPHYPPQLLALLLSYWFQYLGMLFYEHWLNSLGHGCVVSMCQFLMLVN